MESFQLPPCKDSLKNKTLRANYQAGICKWCLQQHPTIPSPASMEWKLQQVEEWEDLQFDWMDGELAPDAVLDYSYLHVIAQGPASFPVVFAWLILWKNAKTKLKVMKKLIFKIQMMTQMILMMKIRSECLFLKPCK